MNSIVLSMFLYVKIAKILLLNHNKRNKNDVISLFLYNKNINMLLYIKELITVFNTKYNVVRLSLYNKYQRTVLLDCSYIKKTAIKCVVRLFLYNKEQHSLYIMSENICLKIFINSKDLLTSCAYFKVFIEFIYIFIEFQGQNSIFE